MLKIKFYGLVLLSVIGALLGFYNHARKTGERAEQQRQRDIIKKVKKESNYVEEIINRQSDVTVRNRMRDKWTRPDV